MFATYLIQMYVNNLQLLFCVQPQVQLLTHVLSGAHIDRICKKKVKSNCWDELKL